MPCHATVTMARARSQGLAATASPAAINKGPDGHPFLSLQIFFGVGSWHEIFGQELASNAAFDPGGKEVDTASIDRAVEA